MRGLYTKMIAKSVINNYRVAINQKPCTKTRNVHSYQLGKIYTNTLFCVRNTAVIQYLIAIAIGYL